MNSGNSRNFTIKDPASLSVDEVTVMYVANNATLDELFVTTFSDSSGNVDFGIYKTLDRSVTGTLIANTNYVANSTSSLNILNMSNNSIEANNFVYVKLNSVNGDVKKVNFMLDFSLNNS